VAVDVNWTTNGALPVTSLAVKEATGGEFDVAGLLPPPPPQALTVSASASVCRSFPNRKPFECPFNRQPSYDHQPASDLRNHQYIRLVRVAEVGFNEPSMSTERVVVTLQHASDR
jgi:hypothetical protein